MTLRIQSLPDARGLRHLWPHRHQCSVYRTCRGISQMGSRTEGGRERTRLPMPNQEAICSGYLLRKWKPVFFSGASLSLSTTLRRQVTCLQVADQCKMSSTFCFGFYGISVSFCFVWLLFLFALTVLALLLLFHFWEREWEHEGVWIGSGRSWGRETWSACRVESFLK